MTPHSSTSTGQFTTLLSRVALVAGLLLSFSACKKQSTETTAVPSTSPASTTTSPAGLASVDQRVSYGIGYNMGSNLGKQKGLAVDLAALKAGIETGLAGGKSQLTEAELEAAFAEMQPRVAAAAAAANEAQLAAANKYVEENKARPGVKVTESGLQYEVLKSGTGAKPKSTDTVEVHYHGTLVDGTVFDSSVERGETATFPVTGVIPGWVEALQLMSVGDKWKLTIPPALGYGPRGAGNIPPNSALIFEVELIAIK